jgi:hypothetical protein
MSFITFGRDEWKEGTWIDHLLHAGDAEFFEILGAFNDLGSLLDGLSDHKPLMAAYRTSPPLSTAATIMPKPRPRPELPRSDTRQIAEFQAGLSAMLSQVAPIASTIEQAEEALELSTQCVINLVRTLNDSHHSTTKRHKDGYSPELVLRKFHLSAIIDIRRHLTGQHNTRRWQGYANIQHNVHRAFLQLNKLATQLGISQYSEHPECLTNILAIMPRRTH